MNFSSILAWKSGTGYRTRSGGGGTKKRISKEEAAPGLTEEFQEIKRRLSFIHVETEKMLLVSASVELDAPEQKAGTESDDDRYTLLIEELESVIEEIRKEREKAETESHPDVTDEVDYLDPR